MAAAALAMMLVFGGCGLVSGEADAENIEAAAQDETTPAASGQHGPRTPKPPERPELTTLTFPPLVSVSPPETIATPASGVDPADDQPTSSAAPPTPQPPASARPSSATQPSPVVEQQPPSTTRAKPYFPWCTELSAVTRGDFALGPNDTPRVRELLFNFVNSLAKIQQTGPPELVPLAAAMDANVTAVLAASNETTTPEQLVSLLNSILAQAGPTVAAFFDQAAIACGFPGATLTPDAVVVGSEQ